MTDQAAIVLTTVAVLAFGMATASLVLGVYLWSRYTNLKLSSPSERGDTNVGDSKPDPPRVSHPPVVRKLRSSFVPTIKSNRLAREKCIRDRELREGSAA